MNIQLLAGGLANQIRQYVFVRYAERRNPQQLWLFDDTHFFTGSLSHNGYELESVFGIHANLASQYFARDTWKEILRLIQKDGFFPQILLDAGLAIVLAESTSIHNPFRGITVKRGHDFPNTWELPYSNVYYFDYWMEDDWFLQNARENRAELAFPPLKDYKNLKYAESIQCGQSVGIHVRRGDFERLGWCVAANDYRPACEKMLDQFPHAAFFVFSDDLSWCKAHAEEMGLGLSMHTVFVEGNNCGRNYIDMQLMSMCKGLIRPAQSSFSQVAAWLNSNLISEIRLGKLYTE